MAKTDMIYPDLRLIIERSEEFPFAALAATELHTHVRQAQQGFTGKHTETLHSSASVPPPVMDRVGKAVKQLQDQKFALELLALQQPGQKDLLQPRIDDIGSVAGILVQAVGALQCVEHTLRQGNGMAKSPQGVHA